MSVGAAPTDELVRRSAPMGYAWVTHGLLMGYSGLLMGYSSLVTHGLLMGYSWVTQGHSGLLRVTHWVTRGYSGLLMSNPPGLSSHYSL